MDIQTPADAEKIRELNDLFRKTFIGGVVVMTQGVSALADSVKAEVFYNVKAFRNFDQDSDPHCEHDFGSFDVAGTRFYFKLDYYDKTMEMGSENPADPLITKRVLTIMKADEY